MSRAPKSLGARLEAKILDAHNVQEGEAVPEDVARLVDDVHEILADPSRFLEIAPRTPNQHAEWRVAGVPGARRAGQVGTLVASLHPKPHGSQSVVLRFGDGKLEAFGPFEIFPYREEAALA